MTPSACARASTKAIAAERPSGTVHRVHRQIECPRCEQLRSRSLPGGCGKSMTQRTLARGGIAQGAAESNNERTRIMSSLVAEIDCDRHICSPPMRMCFSVTDGLGSQRM